MERVRERDARNPIKQEAIYNGVKKFSIEVVLNRIRAFPKKRNENWRTIF